MASVGICLAICPVVKPGVMNLLRSVDSELARSGASMNPARILGPDIVSEGFTGRWCAAGDIAGAAVALYSSSCSRRAAASRPGGRGGGDAGVS
jgi:hypothetical protein